MKYVILFSVIIMFCLSQISSAQIPQTISYQGLLTAPDGTPVADKNYNLMFSLYNVNAGGSPLWSETQTSVPVVKGIFNVVLGSVTPLSLSFDQTYWLGVTISGGSEFSPRIQLTSAPYSLNARAVADNSITSSKISNGQVVKSLNSLKDNVTLAAGTNISITPSGNTLTISSSGGVGSGWNLTGNSGTNPASNFLGTTDNQPLELRVNNLRVLRIEPHSISPNFIGGFSGNSVAANKYGATIGGGGRGGSINQVKDIYGTVGGGENNTAGLSATVGGGYNNAAERNYATISGGANNQVTEEFGTIGGGLKNTAKFYATVGGGSYNHADAAYATIGGGGTSNPADIYTGNRVSDDYGTVGGGGNNLAGNNDGILNNAIYATVGGGESNIASGHYSFTGGGQTNVASGHWSTIPGGLHNAAIGKQSFAAGTRAYANGMGSFVWGDSNSYDLHAWNANEFVCRATGGFWFITKVDNTGYPIEGMWLPAGKSVWFPLGSTTSALSREQEDQIQRLEEENMALKKRVDDLESRLNALEEMLYTMDKKQ